MPKHDDFHERVERLRAKQEFMRIPAVRDIERRVDESGLRYTWNTWKDGSGEAWLTIDLYGDHHIRVDRESYEFVVTTDFESWRGIRGFAGYVNLSDNSPRCRVDSDLRGATLAAVGFEPVGEPVDKGYGQVEQPSRLTVRDPGTNATLTLESVLLDDGIQAMFERRVSGLLLVVHPADVSDGVSARAKLARVADAFFFELDARANISMKLSRPHRGGLSKRRPVDARPDVFVYPEKSYDQDAIQLYQYARELSSKALVPMRSAAYLAYYHVLEYFMPAFSRQAIIHKVRDHLADPQFDAGDDLRVGRLINEAISGKRSESERNQLRSTIRLSSTDAAVTCYLRDHETDAELLSGPDHIADVRRISPSDTSPLLEQCADRIYDIRCRIVHSKEFDNTGRSAAIFASGEEESRLDADIELIEFFARSVIATSGRRL